MTCLRTLPAALRAFALALLLPFAAAPAPAATPAGTVITNTAHARWSVGQTPSVARAEQRFAVQPYTFGPELKLAKTGPAEVGPGGAIVWRLLVSNNGSSTASDVRLQDSVPPQVESLAASCAVVTAGSCGSTSFGAAEASGTPFTAVISSLPPGGRVEVVVRGTVAQNATSFVNRASVSVPGLIDPTPDDNQASLATAVVAGYNAQAATLRGHAWLDADHDRLRGAAEPGLPGISVRVYDSDGTTLAQQTLTGADGAYSIAGLVAGQAYQLEFRDTAGAIVYERPVTSEGGGSAFAATVLCAGGAGSCYTLTQQGSTAQVRTDGRTALTLQPGDNLAEQSLPLDPSGVIYDSSSRAPLAGATVTLVGPPGFDPAAHLLGGAANVSQHTDAGGRYQFVLAPGFPAGLYRLSVTPPPGYVSPSVLLPAAPTLDPTGLGTLGIYAVQPQAGAPQPGASTTYHLAFDLAPGDPEIVNNHLPLDPVAAPGSLTLAKSVNRSIAAVGDLLQYRLQLGNTGASAASAVQVADTLPRGLRYRSGSLRIAGVRAEPQIGADGRTLTIAVGMLAAGGSVEIRYVAEVGAGTPGGAAINTAQASAAGGVASLPARARVDVEEDLFASRIVLVGRVIEVERCRDDDDRLIAHDDIAHGRGVAGALVTLQDGTRVRTDAEGKWHVDGLRAGTHVVQLDVDSLPPGYEPLVCRQNTRRAGRTFSQFVNAQGGTLWRADFHVKKTAAAAQAAAQAAPAAPAAGELVEGSNTLYAAGAERFDANWLASAAPGFEIVFPPADFNPGVRAAKVMVKHDPEQRIELLMNGQPVHALNRDGGDSNAAGTVALSRWGGVPLREGTNHITAVAYDNRGNELGRAERELRFAAGVVQAQLVAAESTLKADGRTAPVIALRMLDADGKPARPGIDGTVRISAPYQALAVQRQQDARPLLDDAGNEPHWRVGTDGIARLRLEPTTASGEVELTFNFPGREPQRVRAWLEPELRDWILVGFAEGTIGHSHLSGNVESLPDNGRDEHLGRDGQIAFYAKGKVRGDWLLTIAYDSDKERRGRGGNAGDRLGQLIDRKQYYTVYGDATSAQHDAASLRKLYLKIERKQFYALFGDFDTGLTVTELARYSRTLNGVKSEYRGEQFVATGFAARGAQAFVKDELRGDGSSGLYRLSRGNIIANSEKVVLQTRDRFQLDKVTAVEPLARGIDYDIDYTLGTIVFRRAITSRNQAFDPILIVVDYEAEDSSRDNRTTAGGRAAAKFADGRIEIGTSAIHEGSGVRGDLGGVDVTVQIDAATRLKAELAHSGREATAADPTARGNAYLIELRRQDKDLAAGAYLRRQDAGFGLGQQSTLTRGSSKLGADASLRLSERLRLHAQAYDERIEADGLTAERAVVEGRANVADNGYGLYGGARGLREHNTRDQTIEAGQFIAGGNYLLVGTAVNLTLDAEVTVAGSDASTAFPHRLRAGVDYKLSERVGVFAEQEFTTSEIEDTATTRVGLRSTPWQGAEAASSINLGLGPSGPAISTSLGLAQTVRVNERLSFSAGIDRTATVREPDQADQADPANPSAPAPQGFDSLRPASLLRPAEDYFSLFGGLAYHDGPWGLTLRADQRNGETIDRRNVAATVHRDLAPGEALAAALLWSDTQQQGGAEQSRVDLRLNYAQRPIESRWIVLNRFDIVHDELGLPAETQVSRRVIDNFNANWQPSWRTQLALQYGAKYVLDSFDGDSLHGYTDLIGTELRHDIGHRFDLGWRAAQLHSWHLNTRTPSWGLSAGTWPIDNLWLGVGYNFVGFRDTDFSAAGYTAQGWYLFFRFKFDQGERDTAAERRAMFDPAAR